uniref:rRNA N-glycosylase n=1 Tax=Globodera pallida TaxID=36090 RepID=A0A183CH67_GLOPA
MFCSFLSLGILFISAAINAMSSVDVMSNLLSEEAQDFINSRVLPPGSYQLLFWDKFVNRFFGNLESAELFAIDANGNLKFKKGAFLRMNDKKAISERFFRNRLQYIGTDENGEFTFNRNNGNENRPVHVYLLPLDSDGGPLMSVPGSDIAEQTDQMLSSDSLALPTVIRYHSLDRRNKIVLEMFERWLFGKSKLLSQSDCFFVEAYIRQMYKHLNGMIMNRGEQHTTDQSEVIEEDFKLYSELGSMLSHALHSRQLADRVLMVEDILGDIRMLCASISTLRAVQQHKSFDEFGHWGKLCQNLDNLWDVAVSRAIDRWLTEAKGAANQQLQMGDANALSAVAEELSHQMQTIAQMLEDGPTEHHQPMPFSLEDQLNQVPMLGPLGRKLETARQTNAKWAERVTAVSGMLEHLGILCEAKSAIAKECTAQSRWTREIEGWHSFCVHLKVARNVWVLRAIGRWLYGSKELRSDEQYLLEMQLENLAEKMVPDSAGGAMSLADFALLSRIGIELVKAQKSKRLAARAMTVPGLWDQLTNICTVIEGFMARSRRPLATCWVEFCGKLEELDVIVVMNALERWRAGTPCKSDPRVIIEASKKALRTVRRVAADVADRRGTPPMSGVESALLTELGAYLAEEFETKKAAAGPEATKLPRPSLISMEGMDKVLREQCNRWAAFRRNIPPESRKMFVSWSKICKAIDLKEINTSEKEKMRDKIDEQMAEGQREVKERSVKRKEEEMAK